MRKSTHFGLRKWATTLGLAIASASVAHAGNLIERSAPSIRMAPLAEDQAPSAKQGEVEVFVRLDAPSIAAYNINEILAGRATPDASMQKSHAADIGADQDQVSFQLEALGARELSRLRAGDNGFRIRIDASQLESIRSIVGVSQVAPVTIHTPDLARSVPWIGADVIQNIGVDGTDVTIAVIDTGIDYTHANFGGSGDTADYISNDPNVIESGSFPTGKVTGGFDFAGAVYDAGSSDPAVYTPVPDYDPLDGSGHGSHVGGIAAGLGVTGTIGSGVAPGASILALKVFGDNGGSTSLTSDAIEYALDPNGDGDISDHVDVINMSLGSGFGNPKDPSAVAADNASKLGIIVVASAGNSGAVPYITGSPGVAKNAISVASTLSGGETLGFEVYGDTIGSYEAIEGTGPVRMADGIVSGNLITPQDAANVFGCAAIDDDMTGAIALISRGACSFDDKFINAQNAGAVAIIVYNDGTSEDRIAPIIMGGVGDAGIPITIPGLMTTAFAGQDIIAGLENDGTVSTALDESVIVATLFGDTISSFSSRGPGHGGSTFKPDVSAPGSAITSTGVGMGTGSLTYGGTSMAAPHVAGVAALLKQVHPKMKPKGIKALIQNSASAALGTGTVGPVPPLARQGTGVVNAMDAVNLTSFAAPGGVSFGRINPSKNFNAKKSFNIRTLTRGSRHYTVTHEPNQTFPGVEISCPSSAKVRGKKSHKLHIKLKMDPTVGPYDDALHSQTEVDGWCVFEDGTDTLRVGYMAVIDPASDMRAEGKKGFVKIKNKKGNVGWAEGFTLTGRDGLVLKGKTNAFNAIGVRTGSAFAFGDLVEFGVSTDRTWESLAPYEVDIFIDVNKDGVDDYILVMADFFGDGVPVTAIFPQGAALFDSSADLNDATAVMTFIGAQDSPLGDLGFLPAGDTDFDYTAFFIDLRDDSFDVQFGSVDLANEIIPDANSFGLFPDSEVEIPVSGEGEMLWLFQNNEAKKGKGKNQAKIVHVHAAETEDDE